MSCKFDNGWKANTLTFDRSSVLSVLISLFVGILMPRKAGVSPFRTQLELLTKSKETFFNSIFILYYSVCIKLHNAKLRYSSLK